MSERDPLWDGLRDLANENHKARIAKTPGRIQYAISQFEKYDIEYALKNEATGHFHCRRKADDKLFQFYARTGKIQGHDSARGIHALIKILLQEVRDED